MRCVDCQGTGQHPVDVQCSRCLGRGHDGSGVGWPDSPEDDASMTWTPTAPEPVQE